MRMVHWRRAAAVTVLGAVLVVGGGCRGAGTPGATSGAVPSGTRINAPAVTPGPGSPVAPSPAPTPGPGTPTTPLPTIGPATVAPAQGTGTPRP